MNMLRTSFLSCAKLLVPNRQAREAPLHIIVLSVLLKTYMIYSNFCTIILSDYLPLALGMAFRATFANMTEEVRKTCSLECEQELGKFCHLDNLIKTEFALPKMNGEEVPVFGRGLPGSYSGKTTRKAR